MPSQVNLQKVNFTIPLSVERIVIFLVQYFSLINETILF